MRDDLFSFTFMGHRVCVVLDDNSRSGWSYCIDGVGDSEAMAYESLSQRLMLEEAGMAARDHIRAMARAGTTLPLFTTKPAFLGADG